MTHVRKFKKPEESTTKIYIHCQNPNCRKLVMAKSFFTQYCKDCEAEMKNARRVVVQ